MTEPATASPASQLGPLEIHPKVAFGTLAGIVVHAFIQMARAHGWIDLSADEPTIILSVSALVAYYVPGVS